MGNPSDTLAQQLGFGGAPPPAPAPAPTEVSEAVKQPNIEPYNAPSEDTQTLIDKTGKHVYMPHDRVQDALLSGQYGLQPDETIPVAYNGHIGQASLDKLPGIVAAGGRVATPREFEQHVLQRDYGDVTHGLEAFGYNALNTALFDVPSAFVPEDARKTIRNINAANPNAAMAGQGVGIVAPIIADIATGGLLTPALGADAVEAARLARLAEGGSETAEALRAATTTASKVLATPTSLASKVGDGVEAAMHALIGQDATSLAGKLTQKALAGGARAGVETALYGAADAWGEDNLKDKPELTGEKLWNVVSNDFWSGAALGAAIPVAGLLSREVGGRLVPSIENRASKFAMDAVDPTGSLTKGEDALTRREQDAARRELIDKGVIKGRDKITDIAPKVADQRAQAERKLYGLYKNPFVERFRVSGTDLGDLITSGPEPLALKDIVDKVVDLSKLNQTGTISLTEAAKIADEVADRAAKLPPSERKVSYEFVQKVDSYLEKEVKSRSNRQALFEYLKAGGNRVEEQKALQFFKTLDETLPAARQEARLWRRLDDAAQATAAKVKTPLEQLVSQLKSGAVHAVVGGAVGGALGAAHGGDHEERSIGEGVIAGIVGKLIKDRGASTAAVWLDKLATIGAARRAALAEDRLAKRAWNQIKEGEFRPPQPKGDLNKYDLYSRAIEKWETQSVPLKVNALAATMMRHAPKTAQAFQQAALRSVAYLQQQMPKPPKDPSQLNPKWNKWEPSDLQKAKFAGIADVVINPVHLMDRVLDGSVTPDMVKAVQSTHPERFIEMQLNLAATIGNMSKPPPQAAQRAMNIILQQPPVDPQLMGQLQGNYHQGGGGPGGGGGKKGGGGRQGKAGSTLAGLTSLPGGSAGSLEKELR